MNPDLIKEDICLWIDGVGGYAMCSADTFRFGSTAGKNVDASIFADIPGHTFTIATMQESSLLYPETPGITINGKPVERPSILKNLDRIEVLGRVALIHRRPNPLSRTSVLTLASRHRWNHHVDGVILMSHCCLIGNSTKAHIFNPHSEVEWMLTLEKNQQWSISNRWLGSPSDSNGQDRHPLTPMRRFKGEGIQLTLAIERQER